MKLFTKDDKKLAAFSGRLEALIGELAGQGRAEDIAGLCRLKADFAIKTDDFYREDRKLNIGVIGQVKAGKSSFLNTLLFDGKEVLPKASTPKTATLTKMEYAAENVIKIEYYAPEEWKVLEENAGVDSEEEIYTSARELVGMARRSGITPEACLAQGCEEKKFASYEELVAHLNDYVGEDGKYTPIVKAVTLQLNKEEFRDLSIVDTPGLNDPIASRTMRTKQFMEVCDVVFFLSQAGSFLDKSDWDLLSSQLPQKGVKKLVLIASKYDSGIRDVLKVKDEDDIFAEEDNTADNIPKACQLVKKKLRKRARGKVEEFVADLVRRGKPPELIEVVKQCAEPIMLSALAANMRGKSREAYTAEERNTYAALRPFSTNMEEDLRLLGDFTAVESLFAAAVREKEAILEAKERTIIPNAVEELKGLLEGYLDRTQKRIQILEGNDREQLLEQKQLVERQMGSIRADIATVFGDLKAKLEAEKQAGIRELRSAGKDYLSIKERTGTRVEHHSHRVSDSKWYNPFSWFSSHVEYYTTEEHYSYCIAADAIENLQRYGLEASNQVEEVFSEAVQVKEVKRRLLNLVVNNFDMGNEKYDASLFRIMIEETISNIDFPVFHLDISEAMTSIAGRFSGEITSASQKTALTTALAKAVEGIYQELCTKLEEAVKNFKEELSAIAQKVETSLLANISKEFEELLSQWDNKEEEIAGYKAYADLLEAELKKVNREWGEAYGK